MLLITCPHCGPRNSSEFTYHGESKPRPAGDLASPAGWRDYLYFNDNTAGTVTEEWFHAAGCRRYLAVVRNTVTNEIGEVRDRGSG
jgi:heterotetrameric sarcosine oxidase delta subunit